MKKYDELTILLNQGYDLITEKDDNRFERVLHDLIKDIYRRGVLLHIPSFYKSFKEWRNMNYNTNDYMNRTRQNFIRNYLEGEFNAV